MYWALALGEESNSIRPSSKMIVSPIVMTVYPAEFHRRCEQKWERRADASGLYESARRMPWLLAIGLMLRAELDAVEQPLSGRLAAVLKELEAPTAT
jgi:hypothetical protein